MKRSETHELLSKTDILEQYRIPEKALEEALINGQIKNLFGVVVSKFQHYSTVYPKKYSRYYIPRHAIESWIDSKVMN